MTSRNLAPIVRVDFDPSALDPLKARAAEQLDAVTDLAITCEEDEHAAGAVLVSVAAVKKEAAAQSKEWLAPLKAEESKIRAPFKAIEDLCDRVRTIVDRAMGDHQLAKAKAKREAEAAMLAAVKTDHEEGLTEALQKRAEAAPTRVAGVTYKAFWRAEVVDPSAVPVAYLTPDLKKIGAHASSFAPEQDPTPIQGVRFVLDTSSTVRTKGLV